LPALRVALVDRRQRGEVALDRARELLRLVGGRDDAELGLAAGALPDPALPAVGAEERCEPWPLGRRDEHDGRHEQDDGEQAHGARIPRNRPLPRRPGWQTRRGMTRRIAILASALLLLAGCGGETTPTGETTAPTTGS